MEVRFGVCIVLERFPEVHMPFHTWLALSCEYQAEQPPTREMDSWVTK
jgi:hypothetical protein